MSKVEAQIRSYYVILEETVQDGQKKLNKPTRKAAAAAVFKNPFAGKYEEDLSLLTELSEAIGNILTKKAVQALGVAEEAIESYGKAAIIGALGEREHAAAVMHPSLGKPIRANVGGGKALIPSAKKMGAPGTAIDVPLGHKNAAFVRSHFDAMEVRIPDAPWADEIVLIVAVADSGRPNPRVGGLQASEIIGEDGLK